MHNSVCVCGGGEGGAGAGCVCVCHTCVLVTPVCVCVRACVRACLLYLRDHKRDSEIKVFSVVKPWLSKVLYFKDGVNQHKYSSA